MKPLILFFVKYLLAPLLAIIMVSVMGALKSVRQQLSVKRIIVFSLITAIFLAIPSLLGYLRNEYVWGGLFLTVVAYLVLGFFYLWALRTFISKKNDDMAMEILVMVLSGIFGMWSYYLIFDWISNGLEYTPWAMTAVWWFLYPTSYLEAIVSSVISNLQYMTYGASTIVALTVTTGIRLIPSRLQR